MSSDDKKQENAPMKGEFKREASAFRDWITADGPFQPEKGRYHLYVSLACPWAHRTLTVRAMKGLENVISDTVVDWYLEFKTGVVGRGWTFTDKQPKTSLDTLNNCETLKELYLKANPDYTGRVTVPVLWDKKTGTVVNNESSEIIRMLNKEFNAFCATEEQRNLDLYPQSLAKEIDEVNAWVYETINNGVYRCGFAKTQEAYDDAVVKLFASLDRVEEILSKSRYLCGNQLTEADVRLFTTLVRFDTVYVNHFKCNKKRIVDYPNIWGFTRDVYQVPGVKETVDQEHIQKHYQMSHTNINPTQIVAIGPDLDFDAPHGRDTKFQK